MEIRVGRPLPLTQIGAMSCQQLCDRFDRNEIGKVSYGAMREST